MINEHAMLLEQRDLCRSFATQAKDLKTAQKFAEIAEQYELRAAGVRTMQLL